ncbi:MAG: hypothetical protein JKX69_01305 [Rhodobacteraceae bacterium]|nr:hypothetical protein [Paracoccaceae bacterium]
MTGPIARIIIRYGVGLVIGLEAAELLVGDADVVAVVAAVVGLATEAVYALARRKGWAT